MKSVDLYPSLVGRYYYYYRCTSILFVENGCKSVRIIFVLINIIIESDTIFSPEIVQQQRQNLADDSLLFFEASVNQANKVNEVLRTYEASTGQLLSPAKCSLMLGQKCSNEEGERVSSILMVENMTFDEKYLGLPIPEGCMKNDKFKPTKEKLQKKCSDWSEKYMSGAAKETLVKSVAQAVANYAMSVFKFSASLCDELSQIIRNFWWGDELDRKKVHWMGWDRMTRPKSHGGIGFRDLRLFNQALLAKQTWHLIVRPDSLCARILKAKYYPNGDLLDTAFSQSTSPCWQGIMYGLELLKQGVIWRINSGSSIRIWRDNWLPRGNLKSMGNASKRRIRWVSDLIDPSTKTWKEELVREIFYPPDAETVLQLKIPSVDGEDILAWHPERSGLFTVRSAYRLALELKMKDNTSSMSDKPAGDRDLWNMVWKANVPPKVRVFGWKLATNTLGVQALRCSRNMDQIATAAFVGWSQKLATTL
jgi:hypothetical protein